MKTHVYKPVLFHRYQRLALALRGLAGLVALWPLFIVLWAIFSPVGPHVLIESPDPRHIHPKAQVICTYVGFRGRVELLHRGGCPFITVIDRRGE